MKYVKTSHAHKVIERAFPDCYNVVIVQRRCQVAGQSRWINCDETPLSYLPYYYDTHVEAVKLKLSDRNHQLQYPDYELSEFVEEFLWEPLDHLEVYVNQGKRAAVVLAVVDNEALIEYEMPAGTTALWIIDRGQPYPGCKRNVSYKNCPQKWLDAIREAGTEWIGNHQ